MNAAGGFCSAVRFRWCPRDTATNEALAVTKVRKLVTQDKVDLVFGGITSSVRSATQDTIVNRTAEQPAAAFISSTTILAALAFGSRPADRTCEVGRYTQFDRVSGHPSLGP